MSNYPNIDISAFPNSLSDNSKYIKQLGLRGLAKLKFKLKLAIVFKNTNKRLKKTIKQGACFYGPFKGEFGHFLAHTLPFIMYLHKHGVKVHYCGMKLHAPFLVDDKGNSIVSSFHELRDFFAEVSPSSNSTIPPKDVQNEIDKFIQKTKESTLPFWNISDNFYYWFIHRNWVIKGHTFLYDLSQTYKTKNEISCAIFPRSKGATSSKNNGQEWDYSKLIKHLTEYFDKVYVLGHPSQVLQIPPMKKVELRITTNNAEILEACSNSQLIISQHSGTAYLGEFLNKKMLIIYKGGSHPYDIGSLNNTLRFRKGMNEKIPLDFAFSELEIIDYVKKMHNI